MAPGKELALLLIMQKGELVSEGGFAGKGAPAQKGSLEAEHCLPPGTLKCLYHI